MCIHMYMYRPIHLQDLYYTYKAYLCTGIFHHICMSYLILAEGFARLLDSPNLSCFFMQHADLFRTPG